MFPPPAGMAKTVPGAERLKAAFSPLEVKCLENVQPNQDGVRQLDVAAPDKTLEQICQHPKRKKKQISKPDSDDSDSDWTPHLGSQISIRAKGTTMPSMRGFADEFGESEGECDFGEKEKDVRARRPAERKRLKKRLRVAEAKSPEECPSDIHSASNQVNRNAPSNGPCREGGAGTPRPQNYQEDLNNDVELTWCENCEDWFEDSCPACSTLQPDHKAFSQTDDLAKSHTGEKSYQCGVSGKAFSRHERELKPTQTGEKPYQCGICGKAFKHSSNLVVHERTHTGEKTYQCCICGKAFPYSSYLVKHKRTHTGEKPYQCDICGKAFKHSSHLVVHERTHTGEKPYQCGICGKAFKHSSHLVVHERTHTGEKPYRCDTCGKAFSQACSLVKHKQTHTGEKPYQCDICGKAFSQSGNLVRHERTHTGEKPFQCGICGKAFAIPADLVLHKRTHTGEKPYQCEILVNVPA